MMLSKAYLLRLVCKVLTFICKRMINIYFCLIYSMEICFIFLQHPLLSLDTYVIFCDTYVTNEERGIAVLLFVCGIYNFWGSFCYVYHGLCTPYSRFIGKTIFIVFE